MNRIGIYLKDYFRYSNKIFLFLVTLTVSVLIFVNYYFNIDHFFRASLPFPVKFLSLYALFFTVFAGVWLGSFLFSKAPLPRPLFFYFLLLAAPAVYACKMSIIPEELLKIHWITDYWNGYLNIILQWPIKLACVVTGVALLWKAGKYTKHLSTDTSVIGGWLPGLLAKNNDPLPYLLLVLLMAPVIFMAGAGHDFQEVYPKLQMIDTRSRTLGSSLLFELCYGMDFFTIELFFRGFLVLACMRYGGRQAILPMAVFYCTIHFGKPLAECISSFFGGLVLGAVVYNTRSIWGGLILHLGLAWTMEVAGWTYS